MTTLAIDLFENTDLDKCPIAEPLALTDVNGNEYTGSIFSINADGYLEVSTTDFDGSAQRVKI